MNDSSLPEFKNHLLACLPADCLRALVSSLEPVDLPLRMHLEHRGKPVEYIYFPDRGFASVVANGAADRSIEIGLVGREGMTGLAVVMGADRAPHDTYIQMAGSGLRLKAAQLRQAIEQNPTLLKPMLHYAHVFSFQIATTALANGRCKLEERLARWLLMAHDRGEGDRLALTHEFLAVMLGVRRAGVTVALNELESTGLIGRDRGVIVIVDRPGLQAITNGAYGAPEAETKRLFG